MNYDDWKADVANREDSAPCDETGPVQHAADCARMSVDGRPVHECGGAYTCPRCESDFGWCIGAYDDTPALCDECANLIQGPQS
jgi:hypothetical protein